MNLQDDEAKQVNLLYEQVKEVRHVKSLVGMARKLELAVRVAPELGVKGMSTILETLADEHARQSALMLIAIQPRVQELLNRADVVGLDRPWDWSRTNEFNHLINRVKAAL